MMNQFYKFIFIVINVWLSSPVLFCSTYSDNMKEAVPFHLDYTSTPFSFNFQLNPDDYIMESSDSCSYKLFKSENENYVIISSNDCSMSNINNLEPATEYSIEFVFGHGRRLSIKRTKLTTESLNYQVIHFGLKAFEYASVHSFFDENQNEMCRLYDSDTEKQLNCGKKDECNCKTDVVTNLEIGKSYNIRIVKINGTNLGHLSVKTMIKPEFDVSSDSNGLNVKYDYKDIITMPKSCKLFIINNDNSSEALNTESIDLLEHTPAVQETDCNSISNIKLEEKSEQTSHHLILTDRFNQQIHSLTMYSQNNLRVAIFYIGVNSVSYRIHGNGLTEMDRCYAINDSTGRELECTVPNTSGQKCSCVKSGVLPNLKSGTTYDITFKLNNNMIIGSVHLTVANVARTIFVGRGLYGAGYSIDLIQVYDRLQSYCFLCLFNRDTDQEGKCCKNNVLYYGFDYECSGYEFTNIQIRKEYTMQGCDLNGDEWLRLDVATASAPSSVNVTLLQNSYLIRLIYDDFNFIPFNCHLFFDNTIGFPALCLSIALCDCENGEYYYDGQDFGGSILIFRDYQSNVIFSYVPGGEVIITSMRPTTMPPLTVPTLPATTDPTPTPSELPIQPSGLTSLSIGVIVGIVLAGLVVFISLVIGIYFLVKKRSGFEYKFHLHSDL